MSTLTSVPPTALGELRQHVLIALISNPLFSEAEQLQGNHFVHECEDGARLLRWAESLQAEIARRQAAAGVEAACVRRPYALRATLRRLRPISFCGQWSRLPAPSRLANFSSTGEADCRAAAHFQPANSLPFAALLRRPRA